MTLSCSLALMLVACATRVEPRVEEPMPGPSQTFEPPSTAAIVRAPATSAVVEAVPAAIWPEVEAETRWYFAPATERFRPEDFSDDFSEAAELAETHTEAELVELLRKARPLFSEYSILLGALYLQNPERGRARILEHLLARSEDTTQALAAWSPAMSSLNWWAPEPFDTGILDAVACVLAMDPGSWFNHAYLARSAKRRRQPQDVAEVIARLPTAVASTLRHYVWLMDRSTADIEADLRSLGVAVEREVWPGLRAYVDRIDHWTPMDRFRKGIELFSELWWSEPGDSVNPVTAYEHIWKSASDLAPITLRDTRFGYLRATSQVPAKLVLEVRGKAWWITVPDDRVDEDASTALLNRAVPATSRARFQIAKLVRGGHLGLFFGAPEGLEPLVARYRLDEPYFNLATPRAPVNQGACRPTAPGKSPYRSPAPACSAAGLRQGELPLVKSSSPLPALTP
jgi:hypothetical protein